MTMCLERLDKWTMTSMLVRLNFRISCSYFAANPIEACASIICADRCARDHLNPKCRLVQRGSSTTQAEKPIHYTYLKEFRVEQCLLFLQHKCTQHKPFTCFYWHFMNQRHRRAVRRRDGTFNYSPDVYCSKYDETTGICPDGDYCSYLHRTAGDTERRYHLRYYKTGVCVRDTDSRGYCAKSGSKSEFIICGTLFMIFENCKQWKLMKKGPMVWQVPITYIRKEML
ncbi:Putative E3 ubiquitin-protein ligase UNKL [Araneus ventricosus]|uniref:E3 ubiquitin-protein ligase UNKL n=1 Tax=Araneus ventricosus TaxID=182803 RepID=A0A4Y2NNL1_ARAVE|nr:Putative E3 ubiquitin-protein ligase UNKL [Araneus ventricosus]GBN40170.1 Putative E3 ubiquitin-protein ligase UNKL [Araneus ventricosus]